MTVRLFYVGDVPCLVENLQSIVHVGEGQVEDSTEPFELKFEETLFGGTNGNLPIGREFLIDHAAEVAFGKLHVEMFAEPPYVVGISEQTGC